MCVFPSPEELVMAADNSDFQLSDGNVIAMMVLKKQMIILALSDSDSGSHLVSFSARKLGRRESRKLHNKVRNKDCIFETSFFVQQSKTKHTCKFTGFQRSDLYLHAGVIFTKGVVEEETGIAPSGIAPSQATTTPESSAGSTLLRKSSQDSDSPTPDPLLVATSSPMDSMAPNILHSTHAATKLASKSCAKLFSEYDENFEGKSSARLSQSL